MNKSWANITMNIEHNVEIKTNYYCRVSLDPSITCRHALFCFENGNLKLQKCK